MSRLPPPEFSRPIRLDEIGNGVKNRQIVAQAEERTALARRFGLRSLDKLVARLDVRPEAAGIVLEGDFEADLTQSCVATGDPVSAHLAAHFAVRFVRGLDDGSEGDEEEAEIDLGDDDCDLLPLDGERIDLGETVAQSLALNLDPYPRAPNADARLRELGVLREEDAGPFAALKNLKLGQSGET